jgi:hypothetical protein
MSTNTALKLSKSVSDPRGTRQYVPLRRFRQMRYWFLLKDALYGARFRLRNIWCIWCGAAGSFAGHIRTQSPKTRLHLDLGLATVRYPDGRVLTRPSTDALYASIETLSATHPWVDMVDLRMFRDGFLAGEKHALRSLGIQSDSLNDPTPSSTPDPAS